MGVSLSSGESPQKGYGKNPNAGYAGARISSDRGGERGWTLDCRTAADADSMNVFYSGWDGCVSGRVSTEAMIKRFQLHNLLLKKNYRAYEWDYANRKNGVTGIDGYLGNDSLSPLSVLWSEYYSAYQLYDADKEISVDSSRVDGWIESAVDVWEEGFGNFIVPTYTEEKHKAMLDSAGLDDDWKTRNELLKAWKVQEGGSQWGKGSPQTDYRITIGSADEFGSIGFSQVIHSYRYGQGECTVHAESGLNYYDPEENIMGIAVHLSGTRKRPEGFSGEFNVCGGSFEIAFADDASYMPISDDDLVGYLVDGTLKKMRQVETEEDGEVSSYSTETEYEQLAKAIGGYNGGAAVLMGDNWPVWLKKTPPSTTGTSGNKIGSICNSCAYTIGVRNTNYGLPYRDYVWKGGTETQTIEGVETEVDWCFVYGEGEWVSGVAYADAKEGSERFQLGGNTDGYIDRRSDCS